MMCPWTPGLQSTKASTNPSLSRDHSRILGRSVEGASSPPTALLQSSPFSSFYPYSTLYAWFEVRVPLPSSVTSVREPTESWWDRYQALDLAAPGVDNKTVAAAGACCVCALRSGGACPNLTPGGLQRYCDSRRTNDGSLAVNMCKRQHLR